MIFSFNITLHWMKKCVWRWKHNRIEGWRFKHKKSWVASTQLNLLHGRHLPPIN